MPAPGSVGTSSTPAESRHPALVPPLPAFHLSLRLALATVPICLTGPECSDMTPEPYGRDAVFVGAGVGRRLLGLSLCPPPAWPPDQQLLSGFILMPLAGTQTPQAVDHICSLCGSILFGTQSTNNRQLHACLGPAPWSPRRLSMVRLMASFSTWEAKTQRSPTTSWRECQDPSPCLVIPNPGFFPGHQEGNKT